MGVEIRTGVEVGKDITLDELRAQGYKAFYIAIGCQGGRLPGIPNDTVKGCSSAVDLLKEVNANEKYDIKGDVVVIGGGNVAIDVARDSKRCGSDSTKVNMFCLESRETMPASVEEIEEAESEGIVVNPGWGPKEVLVDENGEVRGIVLKKCISVKDADGRFNPQYDVNQLLTVECKHVFFSVGQSIVWGDLLKGSKVELGRGNGAVADALTYQTAEPDMFVGGDVYTGPKFAIDAIAAGKQGAISIHRFVQPHSSLTIGRNRNDFIELDKNDIKVENYDNSSRQIPGHNDSICIAPAVCHVFRDNAADFPDLTGHGSDLCEIVLCCNFLHGTHNMYNNSNCGKTYSTVQYAKICPHCGSSATYLLEETDSASRRLKGHNKKILLVKTSLAEYNLLVRFFY